MNGGNGGPAFPCTNEQFTFGNPQTGDAWPGMVLRDWFAGLALSGLLAEPQPDDGEPELGLGRNYAANAAAAAYRIADAMLAERAKP